MCAGAPASFASHGDPGVREAEVRTKWLPAAKKRRGAPKNVTIRVITGTIYDVSMGDVYATGMRPWAELGGIDITTKEVNGEGTVIKTGGSGQITYFAPYTYSFEVAVPDAELVVFRLLMSYWQVTAAALEKDPFNPFLTRQQNDLRKQFMEMFGKRVSHDVLDADMWPHVPAR